MNTEFGNWTRYFSVITVVLAVASALYFYQYFKTKKKLLQARKKVQILDYRKECDRQLGLGCLAALFTLVAAGLLIASLLA